MIEPQVRSEAMIADPNAIFVRNFLLSRQAPYRQIYGGVQQRLEGGTYTYVFPSPQQAANALALIYEARQLLPEHRQGLAIVGHFLPAEHALAVYGFDPQHEPDRLHNLDRYSTVRILERARGFLYDLGLSPSHARNIAQVRKVHERLDPDRFRDTFGFDAVLKPERYEELLHDPVATAQLIVTATPLLRERGMSLGTRRRDRDEQRIEQVAPTALRQDELRRNIGGYVQDEQDRTAARNEELSFGPERYDVLQRARKTLELEGKHADVVPFEPGAWIQGRIVAYNLKREQRQIEREFIAVEVVSKTTTQHRWKHAPPGTSVTLEENRLTLQRLDGATVAFTTEIGIGGWRVWQRLGTVFHHGQQVYPSQEAAQVRLRELAQLARASAGVTMQHGRSRIAIIPVALFADERFRQELKIRAAMSNRGTPVSLGFQPDGHIAYIEAHVPYGPGSILHNEQLEHVVERPITLEQSRDYAAVVALARSQIAGAYTQQGVERDPDTIRERMVLDNTKDGYECQVLNIGKFYLATRVRDAVAIHELAAFGPQRTFAIGECFGVVYTDGIPHEFDVGHAPVTFGRASKLFWEKIASPKNEFERVLGMDISEILSPQTQHLIERQRGQWHVELHDFMERTRKEFELHEGRTVEKVGDVFRPYNREQDCIDGDVLAVSRKLQLAAVVCGSYFTTVNLQYLRRSLEQGDYVRLAVRDNAFTVEQHVTWGERTATYANAMRAELAKQAQVSAETIILRPHSVENDLYHGVVLDVNPALQRAAVAAGKSSIAFFDLRALNQEIARNDEVTIVTRDQQHYVTRKVSERDRDLAPEHVIREEFREILTRE